MELHVTRDKLGEFIDAKILNLSAEDWVVIQGSLQSSLLSEKDTLKYFQNTMGTILYEDEKKVLDFVETNINMLETIIKAFEEPITIRI